MTTVQQYRQMAHDACVLLRKQLEKQEMERRFREEGSYPFKGEPSPFVFSTKQQYREFVKEYTGIQT